MSSPLLIDRQAPVERRRLDDDSWVDYVPGFVPDAATQLERFRADLPWHQSEVLRYDRYVPEKRLHASVRADSTPLTRQIDLHLQATYRKPFDGAVAILYRNGDDFQGMHSDREMRWLDDTLIAIVVLGQRRPFTFSPRSMRPDTADGSQDIVYLPGEGDLLVMGGACQRGWLHGVPAAETPNPRVSLTWRWTSRRGRPDTNPTYFDGRQFSDRPRQPGTRPVQNRGTQA
jgi:alkylated DNA repair dioxygenase AlkB